MGFAVLSRGIATTTRLEALMDRRIVPLIMCGGAGTRLWPASREVHPKQFLPLFGVRSTFQDTILRVSDATLFARPIVITNTAYRFMVLEQLAALGIEADVLPPEPSCFLLLSALDSRPRSSLQSPRLLPTSQTGRRPLNIETPPLTASFLRASTSPASS